jgi:hypothetical protein
VNVLVSILGERLDLVEELVQERIVPFEQLNKRLYSVVGEAWDEPLRAINEDDALRPLVHEAYASSIPWEAYGDASDSPTIQPGAVREWVTLLPAERSERALALPDDHSHEQKVVLFRDHIGTTGRVSVSSDDARGTVVSVSAGGHCAEPSGGICAKGTCGDCRKRRVESSGIGLRVVCICPH